MGTNRNLLYGTKQLTETSANIHHTYRKRIHYIPQDRHQKYVMFPFSYCAFWESAPR